MAFPKSQSIIVVCGIGVIMQNHAKKWFDKHSSTNAMAAIAIGAMLVFSVAGIKAFADNIQDDIQVSPAVRTIIAGGDTTVKYWIDANSAGGGSFSGCDASDGSSVTLRFIVPAGVTVSPSTLTFSNCGSSTTNTQSATYSSSTPGDYAIEVSTRDKDGNPTDTHGNYNANPAKFTLHVDPPTDSTAPKIEAQITGTLGSNGWYTSDVEVSWKIDEPESLSSLTMVGCDTTPITEDTTPDGVTLTCKATSDGGTAEKSVTIKKDSKAPTATITSGIADGDSFFWGFVPDKPTCEATDPSPGSGMDGTCMDDGYSTEKGPQTVTFTAKDLAGNTAEIPGITYTVKDWVMKGYYQPIDMNNVVNTVKAGSVVPIKFEIFAQDEFTSTSFNGKDIGTFSVKTGSGCSGTTDAVEQFTAAGSTSFRYDDTGGQFIYNWKTPKTPAGECFTVTFTAQDGTSLTAYVKTR
jgi:hypothetical protein